MIFTPGGIVLYQYRSNPSLLKSVDNPDFHVRHVVEANVIHDALGGNTASDDVSYRIAQGLTLCWQWASDDYCVAVVYPDILFEGPRQYLRNWATQLVKLTVSEFALCFQRASADGTAASFDKAFHVLLERSKSEKAPDATSSVLPSNNNSATQSSSAVSKPPTKQQRSWGGEAKVTKEAMNALDMNSETDEAREAAYEKALLEARQAYLPDDKDNKTTPSMTPVADADWSSSLSSFFKKLSSKKRLTAEDLKEPIDKMKTHLQSKNVAASTADALCSSVLNKLKNKQLNSFYSVKTAVQQALGTTLSQILQRNKSDDLIASIRRSQRKQRPYVICILGINGIGKTTTTAKLAYHFQKNKLRPLLVAADTFRAGAVEQLKLHGDCLNVPVHSSGYSVDAATVVEQALQHPTSKEADVVLIDTAGRMPTNPELMGNLQRLISRNSPDCIILVVEALVGTDMATYYKGFSKAAGNRIDGIILTKVDTVDDKMGAAVTLAQQTQTPIMFCGTGQKYHHLEPLSVERVVQALLA